MRSLHGRTSGSYPEGKRKNLKVICRNVYWILRKKESSAKVGKKNMFHRRHKQFVRYCIDNRKPIETRQSKPIEQYYIINLVSVRMLFYNLEWHNRAVTFFGKALIIASSDEKAVKNGKFRICESIFLSNWSVLFRLDFGIVATFIGQSINSIRQK